MSPRPQMSLILRTIAMLRFGLQLMAGLVLISSSPLWMAPAESSSVYASQEEIPTLEHKTPVERELAGGQAHSYRVSLNAGQYVRVMVEQKGIDVAMTLFSPDEAKLAENHPS